MDTITPTPSLAWSDALALEIPVMDDTHREFVDLLAVAEAAGDAELPAHWIALVDHTDAHFGREDEWMRSTGFASANCHTTQHQVVLQVLREGTRLLAEGDAKPARQMIRELAVWFPAHAQTMDAALALHLRRVGYDPETGVLSRPDAVPGEAIHGCGSAACSTHDEAETA